MTMLMTAASPPPMKWYLAANLNALQHAFDQIQVAVLSARLVTGLQPICLIDDNNDPGQVADRLAWLTAAGVSVVPHKAELFGIVRQHFGPKAEIFSGHWLRCDIPILEMDAEFVLYTDIDVIFRKPFDLGAFKPGFLACAPEQQQDDLRYFNSGVVVMNLPALRATRGQFIDVLKSRLDTMQPHDDQGTFNVTYRDRWTRLPNQYNWKPYWGFAPDAVVVHFHGPKPGEARQKLESGTTLFSPEIEEIFNRNPDGYSKFLREFETILRTSDYAPAPIALPPDDWDRIENGRLGPMLAGGWSGAEPWGVWGEGAQHALIIALPDHDATSIEVEFDVHVPLFPTRPRQLVDVLVNGDPVAMWRFTEADNRAVRTLVIPPVNGRTIMIELRPYTVLRICDLDPFNQDVRTLGVALHGVRIKQV